MTYVMCFRGETPYEIQGEINIFLEKERREYRSTEIVSLSMTALSCGSTSAFYALVTFDERGEE